MACCKSSHPQRQGCTIQINTGAEGDETITNITASTNPNHWIYTNEAAAVQQIKVEYCWAAYPTVIDRSAINETPGSAAPYQIDGKPTWVCVQDGLTGSQEIWLVRKDTTGTPSWFMIG
jgi:hypothetical protein